MNKCKLAYTCKASRRLYRDASSNQTSKFILKFMSGFKHVKYRRCYIPIYSAIKLYSKGKKKQQKTPLMRLI